MEIKRRMSKRFAWLLGVLALLSIGLLVACGTKYSASSDGLVIVGSQGSNVVQSFSFNLGNGHVAQISNPPATAAQPSAMAIDPTGAFVYTIVSLSSGFSCGSNAQATAGIESFALNSGGTVSTGNCTPLAQENVLIQGTATSELVDVVPSTVVVDPAGKYLFVANRATSDSALRSVPGSVSVFAISNGGLTEVAGSPFFTSTPAMTQIQGGADLVAVAVTPTVFPTLNAVCSTSVGTNPPTSQFLYVTDVVGNVVWEFMVDPSSGVLSNPPNFGQVGSFPTHSVPSGVAVDACDRFVFVANMTSNNIDAYTICNGTSTQAPAPTCPPTQGGDGSLVPVANSPFSLTGGANGPGPIVVDPFGNAVYVVDTASSMVSTFRISPVSGSLSAGPVVATGAQPRSIAVRSDDNWLFVANYGSNNLSQYSITPATGALSPQPTISTDNSPWGVAVK